MLGLSILLLTVSVKADSLTSDSQCLRLLVKTESVEVVSYTKKTVQPRSV